MDKLNDKKEETDDDSHDQPSSSDVGVSGTKSSDSVGTSGSKSSVVVCGSRESLSSYVGILETKSSDGDVGTVETEFSSDASCGPESTEFSVTPKPVDEDNHRTAYHDLSSIDHYKDGDGISSQTDRAISPINTQLTDLQSMESTHNHDLINRAATCRRPKTKEYIPPELCAYEEPTASRDTEQIRTVQCSRGCGSIIPYDEVGMGMCPMCFEAYVRDTTIPDLDTDTDVTPNKTMYDTSTHTKATDKNMNMNINQSSNFQSFTDDPSTKQTTCYTNQTNDATTMNKIQAIDITKTCTNSKTNQSTNNHTTDEMKDFCSRLMEYNPAEPPKHTSTAREIPGSHSDNPEATGVTGFLSDPLQPPSITDPPDHPRISQVSTVQSSNSTPKKKNRCRECKRKVKFTEIEWCVCRCMHLFCPRHRAAEDHVCQFNWKLFFKTQLEKDNPKIDPTKITRMKELFK